MAKNPSSPTIAASPTLKPTSYTANASHLHDARNEAIARQNMIWRAKTRADTHADINVKPFVLEIEDDAHEGTRGYKIVKKEFFDGTEGPLTLRCPKWDAASEYDFCIFKIETVWNLARGRAINPGDPDYVIYEPGFDDWLVIGDVDGEYIDYEVDASLFGDLANTDRVYRLTFTEFDGFSDPYETQPYFFEIDRIPPGGLKLPDISFAPDYRDTGLTIGDFVGAAGEEKILGLYPAYNDQQPRDLLKVLVRPAGGTPEEDVELATAETTSATSFTVFDLLLKYFIDNDIDGDIEIRMYARDVSGNENISEPGVLVHCLVAKAPTDFKPISIPLHDDDNVISEADGRQDPPFFILDYTNAQVGDKIIVTPSESGLLTYELNVTAVGTGIVAAGILTYPDIHRIHDEIVPDPTWRFTSTWNYKVIRGRFTIEAKQPKVVDYNLILPGGPDPDPTDPIHQGLKPLLVGTDNIIPPGGADKPADAVVFHLGTSDQQVFAVGDGVQIWEVAPDGSRTPIGARIFLNAGQDLADLTVTIPGANLAAGDHHFQWSILRPFSDPNIQNEAWAPVTTVTVRSQDEVPGGPNPLPWYIHSWRDSLRTLAAPQRPNMRLSRTQPGTVYEGVIIRLYGYLNMKVDDLIELSVYWSALYPNADPTSGTWNLLKTFTHTVVAQDLVAKSQAVPEDNLAPPAGTELNTPPNVGTPAVFLDFVLTMDELKNVKGGPQSLEYVGTLCYDYKVTAKNGTGESNESERAANQYCVLNARTG